MSRSATSPVIELARPARPDPVALDVGSIAPRIRELSARGAPFYLYDPDAIRAECAKFTALPYREKSIHFATMANASPSFLQVVKDAGLNVFVNSGGHLEVARRLGYQGGQIVYTASAMSEEALRAAHAAGVVLNLDSVGQLETWWRLHPGAPVGIRCNIGERVSPRRTRAGYFLGKASRLGLIPSEIEALAGDPRICGLHLYLGTDLVDLGYFEECYRHLAAFAPLFPQLRYLDFGGGFGVPEDGDGAFDFETYGRFVGGLMDEVSRQLGRRLKLLLEPGRIVAAGAGYFVCRVDDVKMREGRQLLGVNASSAQFPRPLFYPTEAFHPVALLPPDGEVRAGEMSSTVYGCSTYSRDFLAQEVHLPPARPGDLVVFGQAGAYSASAHTAFLGFPPAEDHYL